MGAQIDGRRHLHPDDRGGRRSCARATTPPCPDRIVAGTWAVGRGDDPRRRHRARRRSRAPRDRAGQAGLGRAPWSTSRDDGFRVRMDDRPRAVDIVTLPYPGFATDLQPQFIALNAVADGAAMVTENLFEAGSVRQRAGPARRRRPHRRPSRAGPRPGAAVRRAGRGHRHPGRRRPGARRPRREGDTTVYDVHHIDRGYAGFVATCVGSAPRSSAWTCPHRSTTDRRPTVDGRLGSAADPVRRAA